jgi:hypothetical protein
VELEKQPLLDDSCVTRKNGVSYITGNIGCYDRDLFTVVLSHSRKSHDSLNVAKDRDSYGSMRLPVIMQGV